MRRHLILSITMFALGACSGPGAGDPGSGGGGGGGGSAPDPEAEVFQGLPAGADQLQVLCARGHADKVARGLCAPGAGAIHGLVDLEHAVGLFSTATPPQFALVGHSTSLVERSVSAINPRAIVFTAPSGGPTTQSNDGSFVQDPAFVTMGFVRGEQFVELAAHDPQANEIHFYLVRFLQGCNEHGCSNGDLLTPAIESGWTGTTVYEDVDIKNTIFDCAQCHQPGGPQSAKFLRMQERRAPWTHWFRNNQNEPGGVSLLTDFQGAHGQSEDYAGIPAALLSTPRSDPLVFEALVENNSLSPQPNEFQTGKIEQQVHQSAPAQPQANMPMGQSPTWSQLYANTVAGRAIPVPYHDVKVTDPQKLAAMSEAYRRVASGQLARAQLPDIRDVFLDAALPDMSLKPQPGSDGAAILTAMCTRCHNPSLDSSIARANFDATNLAAMSRAEKDKAIDRLQLDSASRRLMPPSRFATLDASEIAAAVAELQK